MRATPQVPTVPQKDAILSLTASATTLLTYPANCKDPAAVVDIFGIANTDIFPVWIHCTLHQDEDGHSTITKAPPSTEGGTSPCPSSSSSEAGSQSAGGQSGMSPLRAKLFGNLTESHLSAAVPKGSPAAVVLLGNADLVTGIEQGYRDMIQAGKVAIVQRHLTVMREAISLIFFYLHYKARSNSEVHGLDIAPSDFLHHLKCDAYSVFCDYLTLPLPSYDSMTVIHLDPTIDPDHVLNLLKFDHQDTLNSVVYDISIAEVANLVRWLEGTPHTEILTHCNWNTESSTPPTSAIQTLLGMLYYLLGLSTPCELPKEMFNDTQPGSMRKQVENMRSVLPPDGGPLPGQSWEKVETRPPQGKTRKGRLISQVWKTRKDTYIQEINEWAQDESLRRLKAYYLTLSDSGIVFGVEEGKKLVAQCGQTKVELEDMAMKLTKKVDHKDMMKQLKSKADATALHDVQLELDHLKHLLNSLLSNPAVPIDPKSIMSPSSSTHVLSRVKKGSHRPHLKNAVTMPPTTLRIAFGDMRL